jgi:hypothetical protein
LTALRNVDTLSYTKSFSFGPNLSHWDIDAKGSSGQKDGLLGRAVRRSYLEGKRDDVDDF